MRYLACLIALLALPAFAGRWANVKVLTVTPLSEHFLKPNGGLEVEFSAEVISGPACGSAHSQWAFVDLDTLGGLAMAYILQDARKSGAIIFVQGTGTCGPIPTMETIDYLYE